MTEVTFDDRGSTIAMFKLQRLEIIRRPLSVLAVRRKSKNTMALPRTARSFLIRDGQRTADQ